MSRRKRQTGHCNYCTRGTSMKCPKCEAYSCSSHTRPAGHGDACHYCRKNGFWGVCDDGTVKWYEFQKETRNA